MQLKRSYVFNMAHGMMVLGIVLMIGSTPDRGHMPDWVLGVSGLILLAVGGYLSVRAAIHYGNEEVQEILKGFKEKHPPSE